MLSPILQLIISLLMFTKQLIWSWLSVRAESVEIKKQRTNVIWDISIGELTHRKTES